MSDDGVLGSFHGDDAFPVTWDAGERERLWVFDDLHCPNPLSPMFFDIGGWWLTCDHMFRRFGTPFASDWIAKNVNGYLYTAAIPAEDIAVEGAEYNARYVPRVPRLEGYAAGIGGYLGAVLPHYGSEFASWWRERLRPEIERNFAYLDGIDMDALELVPLAVLLEDAIDIHDRHWKIHWMINFAQFSATLALGATIADVKGDVDPGLPGRLQSSAVNRNWDSIEALWQMKEEVKADPELRAAFGHDTAAAIASALAGSEGGRRFSERAHRPLPRRVRAQIDLVARVHLPDLVRAAGADPAGRARLPRVRLRLPGRGRARQAGSRRGLRRAHGRRPAGRGPRPAAGRARRLGRAQPAHAGPPLLHRPGHQRAPAPRARRDRAQARRAGRAARRRGRVLPQVQRAAHAHRRRPRGRHRSRLAAPRRARGRVRAAAARLDRHGHGRSARVPVPHALGLPREVQPRAQPARPTRSSAWRPRRASPRGARASSSRSTSSTRSRTARSSSAA